MFIGTTHEDLAEELRKLTTRAVGSVKRERRLLLIKAQRNDKRYKGKTAKHEKASASATTHHDPSHLGMGMGLILGESRGRTGAGKGDTEFRVRTLLSSHFRGLWSYLCLCLERYCSILLWS
tara:strand:- start:108 stop:473 length:366 start_codon:yes stop_codon:yes gene_type:complete